MQVNAVNVVTIRNACNLAMAACEVEAISAWKALHKARREISSAIDSHEQEMVRAGVLKQDIEQVKNKKTGKVTPKRTLTIVEAKAA